mmetsp:Transcript_21545/g.59887  ORF Transcript_21545/g.59887 Transcript_21545/m.59887 type:complete len:429 (+) Transcript_21545:234-1520(+)
MGNKRPLPDASGDSKSPIASHCPVGGSNNRCEFSSAKQRPGSHSGKKQGTLDRVLGLKPLPSYFVLSSLPVIAPAVQADVATGSSIGSSARPDGFCADCPSTYSAKWVDSPTRTAGADARAGWRAEVTIGGRHVSLLLQDGTAGGCASARGEELIGHEHWPPPGCTNVSLLKSLLQKAVRRRNKRAATWAAFSLLQLDPTALLRRLPIIMLEDTVLHESLPAIVWMMAAHSKGWQLGRGHAVWLLNVAATLCDIPAWDIPGSDTEVMTDSQVIQRWRGLEPQCSLLLSLKARLAFGGMACDLSMLRWQVNKWSRMFGDGGLCHSRLPIALHIQHLPVPPLPLNAWILAACDFHCSNIVERFLAEHPGAVNGPDELQSLMWKLSSSVNPREAAFGASKPRHREDQRLKWQAIQSRVYKVARAIVQRNLR